MDLANGGAAGVGREQLSSEERYRSFFRTCRDAAFITTRDGRWVDFNEAAVELFGYDSAEALQEVSIQDLYADPADREAYIRTVERQGFTEECPVELRRKDSAIIKALISSVPIEDDEGRVIGFQGTIRDVTEHRLSEERDRERERFVALLNDVTRAALETPDLVAMLQILADRLGELFGADGCYLTLWDEEREMPIPMAAYGDWRDKYRSVKVEPGESTVTESVLQAGRPLAVEDVYESPYLTPRIARIFPEWSLLALPLVARDEKLGVALIAFEDPHQFTAEEIAQGEQVADQIALAVGKAKLVEELREAKEFSETLIDSMQEGLSVIDRDGVHVDVNPAFCRMTGYAREELIGVGPPHPYWAPEAHDEIEGRFEATLRGEFSPFETVFMHKDGERFLVVVSPASVVDDEGNVVHYLATFKDVTERRRAEEGLRRRDAILEAVSFSTEQFLEVSSWEQVIDDVLERLGQAAEVSRVYVFENQVTEAGGVVTSLRHEWTTPGIVPQIDNPELQDFSFQAGGFARWEEKLSHGELIHGHVRDFSAEEQAVLSAQDILSIVIVPVFVGQDWWGFIGFDECVREREWSAAERDALRAAAGGLGAAVQREGMEERVRQQEKLAAIGQLAGGIAHDFNNSLTSIMLFAEMSLQQQELIPRTKHALETILAESRRAADLVQQVLDLSSKAMMETEPLSLAALVREAVTLLRRTIPEHVDIVTEMTSHPCVIQADPTRIHQVLMNLALNAKDAMPEGGELRMRVERVEVALGEEPPVPEMVPGAWACLTVSDTGTGMSEEVQEHLFEPFFTTKEVGKGTGLGLAQVYGIVKQHQGFIDVETALGEGTTCVIFLPLVEDVEEGERTERGDVPPSGGGERVLVIEDAAQLRHAVRAGLESFGYEVVTARTGREALEEVSLEDVDAVLTDVVMPEMGGEALLKEVRARAPGLKVIAMTGHVLDTGVEELEAAGFAGALLKPFSIEELARVVRQALGGGGGK